MFRTSGLKVTVTKKKWLGTTCLPDGKGIGGKGRLTDKLIDKLQVYNGKAIRQNTHDIDCMQNAVMDIWYIQSQLMKIQIMISVPLVKHLVVGMRV